MKLYQYDHCPFCIRVRMLLPHTAPNTEIITLTYDDVSTPTKLINKKMLPILEEDNGQAMGESLDIIEHLLQNSNYELDKTPLSAELQAAKSKLSPYTSRLIKPRVIKLALGEFASAAARDYYQKRHEEKLGCSFAEAYATSAEDIKQAEQQLENIDAALVFDPQQPAALSMADIMLFAHLRNLSVVKGLHWPEKLQAYMQHQAEQSTVDLFDPID